MQRVACVLITSVLFLAQESLSLSCGHTDITNISSAVNFSSVLYPGNPPPLLSELNCTWTIGPSTSGYLVAMEFIDANLEYSAGCDDVFVNIYDGPNLDSPLLEKVCGLVLPGRIESNGSYLFVNFITNRDVLFRGQGFRATVFQVLAPTTSSDEPTTTLGTTGIFTVEAPTTSVPSASTDFYFSDSQEGSSTKLILIITCSIFGAIVIIILVAVCGHKAWNNKIKEGVSRLSAHTEKNIVAPVKGYQSFPILPTKPVLIEEARAT